jgi:3-oxoacyl-[acyl-carrier protein] reductase
MDLGLKDLRALVTGASRGLGYATAFGLSKEGVRLAINSRYLENVTAAAEAIHSKTGVDVYPIAGDLADPKAPGRVIEEAVSRLGGLDLLVTNTGGPAAGKFETFDDEAWQYAIEICLMSHVRLIRIALPHLRKSPVPSVLTMTSYSVKQPIPNLVLSNSVRSATIGLTKTLALELGADHIRFNSILPNGFTS